MKKNPFNDFICNMAKNLPKTEWICEVCKSKNTNWTPVIGEKTFRHGACPNCLKLKNDEEVQRIADIKKQKQEVKAKKDKEYNEKLVIRLLENAKLPNKIANTKFSELEIREGMKIPVATMKRLHKADRWVYLHGTNNTGKTTLISAAIRELTKVHKIPCFYFDEPGFFRRVKETFDKDKAETSKSLFDNLRNAKIIFWDDFFCSLTYTDWKRDIIFEILNTADVEDKIIVFTSNINLMKKYNDKDDFIFEIGKRSIARIVSKSRNNTHFIEMKNKPFD